MMAIVAALAVLPGGFRFWSSVDLGPVSVSIVTSATYFLAHLPGIVRLLFDYRRMMLLEDVLEQVVCIPFIRFNVWIALARQIEIGRMSISVYDVWYRQ